MEAEVSQTIVEGLLTSFMSAALGLEMHERVERLERLPAWYRERLEVVPKETLTWVAWVTSLGVIAATGRYDQERSRQISAHVILIEWWISPSTHHVSWWRADPARPGEWTAGRGHAAASTSSNEKP
jgi:hypothetical protein